MRKRISFMMNIQEMIITMTEGNPGALGVLTGMIINTNRLHCILHLDDMNMRGSQIWIAYKNYCDNNMEKFVDCVQKRDPEMVAMVNKMHFEQGGTEVAVTSGASFK